MDYLDDVTIDEKALDVEWLKQASLTFRYSKLAAEVRKKLDLKKEELELLKADLDRAIRTNPEGFGIEVKITEAVVNATILKQPEYQQLNQEVIELKFEYEVATAAVKAIDAKKMALENLVKLFAQNYFAGPATPRDLSKEWELQEKTQITNQKIVSAIRRK